VKTQTWSWWIDSRKPHESSDTTTPTNAASASRISSALG
jgi:hypothetical protein